MLRGAFHGVARGRARATGSGRSVFTSTSACLSECRGGDYACTADGPPRGGPAMSVAGGRRSLLMRKVMAVAALGMMLAVVGCDKNKDTSSDPKKMSLSAS